MELPAVLALEFVDVDSESSRREVRLSMSEATLVLISARAILDPVLAHFGFELAIFLYFSIP